MERCELYENGKLECHDPADVLTRKVAAERLIACVGYPAADAGIRVGETA